MSIKLTFAPTIHLFPQQFIYSLNLFIPYEQKDSLFCGRIHAGCKRC